MRTTIKRRAMAALVVLATRRVKKSQRVADRVFQASFCFLVIAACAGNLILVFAALAIFAAAAKHLDKVEQLKK